MLGSISTTPLQLGIDFEEAAALKRRGHHSLEVDYIGLLLSVRFICSKISGEMILNVTRPHARRLAATMVLARYAADGVDRRVRSMDDPAIHGTGSAKPSESGTSSVSEKHHGNRRSCDISFRLSREERCRFSQKISFLLL